MSLALECATSNVVLSCFILSASFLSTRSSRSNGYVLEIIITSSFFVVYSFTSNAKIGSFFPSNSFSPSIEVLKFLRILSIAIISIISPSSNFILILFKSFI